MNLKEKRLFSGIDETLVIFYLLYHGFSSIPVESESGLGLPLMSQVK